MTEYPFIYVSSHGGWIGNIRWRNSDTRYPDWKYPRWIDWTFRSGYWGKVVLVEPDED